MSGLGRQLMEKDLPNTVLNYDRKVKASPSAPTHSWVGRMVRPHADKGVGAQASFLRKTFVVKGITNAATLRISALGLYRCFINGKRVGDDQLTPGWTSYWNRLSYQTYDVADLLHNGENVIDIWLGDGWYRSRMLGAQSPLFNTWGTEIGAIADIDIGGTVILATDATWQSGLLPVLKSGIYFGEVYDATKEAPEADQGTAIIDKFDPKTLVAHETRAVKELDPLAVVSEVRDAKGRTVYDFGQNAAGYVAFTVVGERGARIIIEHAEVVDQHGDFDSASTRSAEARVEYVLKGHGEESYRPTFTFFGFRYARVEIVGKAKIMRIVFVPITSVTLKTGSFTSGNTLVNRLVENTIWSQRSNFIEVPTDCPQRDERLGWTGDVQVFANTACYLHDSETFLRKWLRDLIADQRPDGAISHVSPDPTRNHEDIQANFYGSTGWGDAICVVPWVLWQHYGDLDVLKETLPSMVKWVDFIWSISDGPIVKPPRPWTSRGFTFGDWLQPKGPSEKPLPTIGDDAAATIYLYISSIITAKAARLVGDTAIANRMTARAEAVKEAFGREFISETGRLVYDDQTSYALAIIHDLIPVHLLPAVRAYFRATIERSEGKIGTGFIGTPALLPALVKIGEHELAAEILLQEKVPGWLYQIKLGATTIWERWDAIQEDGTAFDPSMNSYNHYAYGAVCQWLFESVAGFRSDEHSPGFRHIIFEPNIIPSLSPVHAHYDSVSGRIEAGWQVEGDKITYDLVIPEQSSGSLILPSSCSEISIDGQRPFRSTSELEGNNLLTPGTHRVTFQINKRVENTDGQSLNILDGEEQWQN